MKKILSAVCLLMLSTAAVAQTIRVVDKQGNATSYDASKLDSVSFQKGTPGFTVHSGKNAARYTFDKVQSLGANAKFLFVHPDTVYVNGNTQKFVFQLNTNVDYNFESSALWLRSDGNVTGTDSLRFVATNNPLLTRREGKLYFVNKADDSMRDTLVVVQAGKSDTHFIDIDWSTTTLNSYNEATGQTVLTFHGEVPEMGQYDAFLLPTDNSFAIRLINTVTHVDGSKTVTLGTREGKMGNLFKRQKFTLATDPSYGSDAAGSRALARNAGIDVDAPVYYPESIELCADGKPFAEVYNRRNAPRRAQLTKDFNIFEYSKDNSGEEIGGGLSWEKCVFDVGLKGVFQFDFGDIAWEKVRFGDLIDMKAYLEGNFNTELILKYALSAGVEWEAEKVLKEDIFSYRVKFMVGPVPVWINISSDLMAGAEAKAEGTISLTGGVKASANLKAGLQWNKATGVTPIYEFEKDWELVEPEIKAEAHAEAKAYTWPRIKIGIYDVLCPTIDPKPYIRAYADARAEKIPYFGWDAGLTAGVDLNLGLSLDLFFWEKEIGEIEPINLVNVDLFKAPQRIDMMCDNSRNVMVGDTCHITYRVMGKNRLTNSEFPLPGALLHIEKSEDGGGTIDSDQKFNDNPEWCYTNKKGEVVVVYTQNDTIPAKINVTLMTGDEEQDIEVPEWSCTIKDYRLTALDVDETENSIIAGSNGKAEQKYLLEEYTKGDAKTNGRWQGMNYVTVNFEVTGGTMEANSAKTKDGGRVTAKFDGGSHYDGKSTLTATAYIAEFDTTLTTPAIKILAFKFEDDDLTKCYNLADNTALCYGAFSNGDILNVSWTTKKYDGYMNWVDIGIAIGKDYNEVIAYTNTESGQGATGYYNGEPHECDYVQTVNWKYTYTHKDVICGYSSQNNLPMDFVGRYTNATSAVQEERYGTVENTSTTHYTYYGTNNQGERVVIGTDTKNSSYGPSNRSDGKWWNAARENTAGAALFEEDGNIVYLYYIIDEQENYRLYVKGVFDKASNTVYE